MPSNRRPMGGRRTVTQLADPTTRQLREAEFPAAPASLPLRMTNTMVFFDPGPTDLVVPAPPPPLDFPIPRGFSNLERWPPVFIEEYGTLPDGRTRGCAGTITATSEAPPPTAQPLPPEPANCPGSFRRMYRLVREMGVELCR